MPLYTIDIRIYGTAYIQAGSPEEALVLANALEGDCLDLSSVGDVEVSDRKYNDTELPTVSLSPAATILGPDIGDTPQLADEEDE